MKKRLGTALIASLSFLVAALSLPAAGRPASAVEQVITKLERRWAQAQKAGNAAAVAPLLAEGFINTDADGQTYGKARLLSNLKGGRWEHNAISNVQVKVYGNTAIATGAWSGKGVDGDGARIDRRERWTDIWIKTRNGSWLCVASQQTAVAQAK